MKNTNQTKHRIGLNLLNTSTTSFTPVRFKKKKKNSGKKKERSIGEVLPADASAGESGKENGNSLAGKTGEKSGGSPRKNGRGYAKKRRSR